MLYEIISRARSPKPPPDIVAINGAKKIDVVWALAHSLMRYDQPVSIIGISSGILPHQSALLYVIAQGLAPFDDFELEFDKPPQLSEVLQVITIHQVRVELISTIELRSFQD